MKVQEAIELINNSDNLYCIDDAIELLEGETELAVDVDISRHRWYETSESYFRLEDGILGIRGVSNIYSEMSNPSDFEVHTRAFEGEEITVVSYRGKSNK